MTGAPPFAARQTAFARALLVPPDAVSRGVLAPEGLVAARPPGIGRRFAVYRNNVASGLTAALAARFPAVQRVVGTAFFAAAAGRYAAQNPPHMPLMAQYGESFPDFLAGFAPAARLPYLADVARIEAARSRAYHAADAEPLGEAAWRALDPAGLADSRVDLHPSLTILRSPHPAVTIWEMNQPGGTPRPVESWSGEAAAVARPRDRVTVTRLPPGGAAFLESLAAGRRLDAAVVAATEAAGVDFDLADALTTLMRAELATALHRFAPARARLRHTQPAATHTESRQ